VATSPLQSEKIRQDAAYARAQDAIATARARGASDLTLSGDDFSDLAVLPPDIGSLPALKSLTLRGTQVSDISSLSGLPVLSRRELRRTPVSDISALSGLTALSRLYLSGTPVSDISALSGLTALIHLDLFGTQVRDEQVGHGGGAESQRGAAKKLPSRDVQFVFAKGIHFIHARGFCIRG
jgi:hypothetical protein